MTTPIFSQLRVLVDDFASSFRFYRDALGLEPQAPEQDSGPYACFKSPDGGTDIALFSRELMGAALGADPGPAGGAVLVLRVDDVDATYAQVIAQGAESVAAPVDQAAWGMRVAHVQAPEGTLIEFCAY
jgi:catechol 2,3-dioxygenase-like lactoylglutathione lyase family enzyme